MLIDISRVLRLMSVCAMLGATGCAGRYQIVKGEFVNYEVAMPGDNGPYTRTDTQPILLDTWTGRTWTSSSSIHVEEWKQRPND
jgi:hypothetical protein